MATLQSIILAATATTSALMAGLFFSFSCSVMPGLNKLPDDQYILAMQSINRAIQNPAFFLVFFGILILLPVSAYLSYSNARPLLFRLLIAATAIYFTGVFAITITGNIPLNNSLDKFDLLHSSKEMIAFQRMAFEGRWNNLNMVRTISSAITIILVISACLVNEKNT